MTIYSIPVAQTTLTQFAVEVTTVNGEEYMYNIFQDPNEGNHPGFTATQWLNEDEAEDESGDESDGEYFVTEYGVFDCGDCNEEEQINKNLRRYYGDGVRIVGDRIEVDNLDYVFIPGCFDLHLYGENEIEEWAKDYNLDLKVLVA
jgi:hypothetical protein